MSIFIQFEYLNMMRLCRAVVAALLFSGLSFYSSPMFAESYVVHTGPNGYPPFLFVDERADGIQYSGIIVDLLGAFENVYPDFDHSYKSMPRKRVNSLIKRGEFTDLMFRSREFVSPSTMEHYRLTHTLIESKDVVVTRRNDEFEYSKPEDLHGKSVAIIRGYSYLGFDELFEKGKISSTTVDLHVQAIGMLEKKRVDAYFGNMIVTPFYLKGMGIDKDRFAFSETALSELNFVFMIHRDKTKLFNALNQFIVTAKVNGVLNSIVNKYLK